MTDAAAPHELAAGERASAGGRILSVNVGQVREIEYRGKLRKTGIWKLPVQGRVAIRGSSLAGDHQADPQVHGGPRKAVYAYAREDYLWWEGQLGLALDPGTFGENLTTSGIELGASLIGERWRAGSAVLQVTQPRVPCWKLGIRMGDRRFPLTFLRAGRTGAYLAVVEAGDVGAGDRVDRIRRPDHPVTVGLVAYLNHHDRQLAAYLVQAAGAGVDRRSWRDLLEAAEVPAELWSEWAAGRG